ncbi:hypothetical protein [Gallibacterium sp. AGMB14963]|uniref:hypothetical protein n=1 Tax=Gallibacterium faecale TaxID=3019086 RepID=UPI0022F1625D|nr:hypothetical protein [Gallibacterium sp. AGMB14963]MDA3979000.1 hypothetical protein [Gallibacterium sp. AGMB14963]
MSKISQKVKQVSKSVRDHKQAEMIKSLKDNGLLPSPKFTLASGPELNKINARVAINRF